MSDFISFCRDYGIKIDYTPPYGVVKAYPTVDKPRKRNGRVFYDGSFGWCQNWATMDEPAKWFADRDDKAFKPSDKELAERKRQAREKARQMAIKQEQAINDARAYFYSLPALTGGHPYFDKKGLTMEGCFGLRRDGDLLVMPLYRDKQIVSLQTITPDGEKKFRYGCPTKGVGYFIGRRGIGQITILCEGFATGLSLYQSIPNSQVIVCFNAGNLIEIAKKVKPSLRGLVVICADNDWKTAEKDADGRNPGLLKGKEASEILGCGLAYPEGIEGSDFDDARREWGEEGKAKVKSLVMRNVKLIRS